MSFLLSRLRGRPRGRLVAALMAGLLAACIGVPSPGAAADWGLTLFVVTEPPASAGGEVSPGPVSYQPGARAVARLLFENRGEAELAKIRVEVGLVGATPAVDEGGAWKRGGGKLSATIDALAPGETVELPLVVELADGTERGARGTGGEARIRATVPASGETLVAEASWPIASCADAYHAALRQVRHNEFAALRAAVDASREADKSLPGATVFPFAPGGKDEASAVRFAEQIARARGLDGYYTSKDIVWVTGRLITDIGVYLGQDRYPGLCTGVAEWTAVLQDYIGRFAKRSGEIRAYQAGLEPAARALVAATGDAGLEQGSGDFEAGAVAAGLLSTIGETAPAGRDAAVFASARDRLAVDGVLTPERRAALTGAFAALERLWYLELAATKASAVADGFTGTLDAIRDAHRTTCTCGS